MCFHNPAQEKMGELLQKVMGQLVRGGGIRNGINVSGWWGSQAGRQAGGC